MSHCKDCHRKIKERKVGSIPITRCGKCQKERMDRGCLNFRFQQGYGDTSRPGRDHHRRHQFHYKKTEPSPQPPPLPRKKRRPHRLQAEYDLLEVVVSASPAEVKRAYRLRALQLHPDKNPGQDTTHLFQALSRAYEIALDYSTNRKG